MKLLRYFGNLLLSWALICIGVLGSMLCVISAFSLPTPPSLWILVPALALIFCLLFQGKPGKFYALGLLLVMLAAVWLFRKELFDSFRNLWGELCGRYARGYDQALDLLPRDPTSPDQVGPALLAAAVLETFLSSLAVRLWKRTTPAALALLPGILPCFILTDTPPSLLPLLAAVFSVVAQALSQSVRRRNAGEEGKAILLAALTAAGLLGLLLYLFPRDSYTPPITWDELTTKMDRWSQNQNDRGNLRAGLSGNPDSVDLSNLSALPNHSATVMQVKASRSMYLYLRGSSYADFDGVTWRRGAEQRWDSLPMLPYLGRRPEVSLTLVTMERVEQLYSTYQITALPSGAEAVSDAYLRNADGRMYYDLEFVTDPGPVEADEAYDRWVRDRCTQLPEETRAGVLAWWEENRGDLEAFPALSEEDMTSGLSVIVVGEDGTGRVGDTIQVSGYVDPDSRAAYLLAYAEAVAAKVSQAASYSRTPERAPRDRDFCTWFLQEAEEGFCVHYASSCTALLRAISRLNSARTPSAFSSPAFAATLSSSAFSRSASSTGRPLSCLYRPISRASSILSP